MVLVEVLKESRIEVIVLRDSLLIQLIDSLFGEALEVFHVVETIVELSKSIFLLQKLDQASILEMCLDFLLEILNLIANLIQLAIVVEND